MFARLRGKLAVVTGGSDALGLAMASAFAQEGAEVALVARDLDKLERAAAQLRAAGAEVQCFAADLAEATAREQFISTFNYVNRNRPIDVLVNNAGMSIFTPLGQISGVEFEHQLSLNVAAPLFLTQGLLPNFRKPGASVINISSYFAGKLLWDRPSAVYSLTKGALNSLTKAMAFELAPRGIRVNAISPGTVDTALRRNTISKLPAEQQARIAASISTLYPLGRIGQPGDISGLAVYLASDESVWTTGAVMKVDGGLSLT